METQHQDAPSEVATEGVSRARPGVAHDAFLSYSHQDRAVARGVQRGLHSIGRRFAQLRALRVFRDASDLTASPDLWGKVVAAMDEARTSSWCFRQLPQHPGG